MSTDPLVAHLRRLNIRGSELEEALRLYEQQRLAILNSHLPYASAPGNPGPVVPVTPPGFRTSEFAITALSIGVIAAICGGLIYGTTQIESLTGEAKAIVYALVGAVASWALKNLGINYADNRTILKGGGQAQ